ncbi:MAG: putative capsular polysaccharide synthesis family protein [Verrucomicrobiota bacterium]
MQRFTDEANLTTNKKIKTAKLQHLGRAVETQEIINQLGQKNITFLAGVREPIALALSLFFEQGVNYGGSQLDLSVDEIQNAIESPAGIWWFDICRLDRWFDEDLLAASEHNVLSKPFPKEIGYKTFRGGKGDLSVYRLENFDSILEALGDVLEISESLLELKKANIAEDKNYAEKYREVLSDISFSDSFIEKIYQSRYAKHFYTSSERESYKSRWSK